MATPLKINNVGGTEIKEFTTAEENYIAYQIGLHLAADSANGDASISTNSSHTSIGTYTNTFFNEPVGTHPSTSISSGSTTTTLYQNQTSAIETDSDVLTPVMWVDSGGQTGFKEMPAADLNSAVDRYISTIFTNSYPGSFQLASSSPGPDYSVWISSVFTDTRTDGTSVAYNIYRRDSFTAPTTVRPLYARDNGGFDGIQAMNDRQIKYSFGQRAKTRIGASKIGTYQLRTSAQGAPTDPGTWVSAGSATDTKQTTADVVYTRDSTTAFARNYTNTYTKNYTAVYTTAYTGVFTSPYAKDYTGVFTSNYQRAYTGVFESNYTKEYTGVFTSNYTAAYTGVFATNYATNYTGVFNANYTKRYTGNYQRAYNYPYLAAYTRQFLNTFNSSNYTKNYDIIYTRHYTPNYTPDFPYTRIYNLEYVGGPYSRVFPDNLLYDRFYQTTYTRATFYERGFGGTFGLVYYAGETPFVQNLGYQGATLFFGGSSRVPTYITSVYYVGEAADFFQALPVQLNYAPGSTGHAAYQRGPTALQFQGPEVYPYNLNAPAGLFYQGGPGYLGPPWFLGGGFQEYNATGLPRYTGPYYQRYYPERVDFDGFAVVGTGYQGPYPSFYQGVLKYEGPAGGFGFFPLPATGLLAQDYEGVNLAYSAVVNFGTSYVGGFAVDNLFYVPGPLGNYTKTYAGPQTIQYNSSNYQAQYKRDYTGQDFRSATFYAGPNYAKGYVLRYNRAYVGTYTNQYTTQFLINYSRDYTIQYVSVTDVAYQTSYTHVDTINYQRAYTHVDNIAYAKAYTHVDTINYVGTYTHIDTIDYAKAYTHVDTINYSTAYTHVDNVPYTSIFTNTFDAQYQTDYIGNFIGNFAGETIQSGSQTEETYTLYVRIG